AAARDADTRRRLYGGSQRRRPERRALGRSGARRLKTEGTMQVDSSKRPCLAARVALVTVALGTAACGVEFEGPIQGEEVSVQEDALGEATCATVDATEQYVYGITPARTSARSYTTAG